MANTDFDPQDQAPPPQPPTPPPTPPSRPFSPPLSQLAQQSPPQVAAPSQPQMLASEVPGVNYTGGRLDAQPRDTQTDLPLTQPPLGGPQRFVPNRYQDHTMWTKPHPPVEAIKDFPGIVYTSLMPSPGEAPGVAAGSSRQLSQWGAPSVQGPARIASNLFGNMAGILGPVLDFYSHGEFRKGYESASLKGLQMQRERMEMDMMRGIEAAHQAYQANEQHLGRYDDILSAQRAQGLSAKQAEDEIRRMAMAEPGGPDQILLNSLHNGGLAAVEQLLKSRHAKGLDLLSAATTMENVKGRSGKTVKEQGEFDKSLGDGSGGQPPLPGKGGVTAAPAGSGDFDNENDAKLGKDHHLSPLGVQAARQWLLDGKPGGETPNAFENDAKQNYANVYAAYGDLKKQASAIADSGDDIDTKLEKLRKINLSEIADGAKKMLDYGEDPNKPENRIYKEWARRIDKTWDAGKYKAVNDYMGANTPTARMILRADAFPTAGLTVLKALKPMSETQLIPINLAERGGTIYVTGDPKYTELYQAIQSYVNEYAGLLSTTGVPRVKQMEMLSAHFKETMSPAQIRAAMQVEARNANALIGGVNTRWQAISKRQTLVPGYSEKSDALTKGLLYMNTKTGEVDSDAPPELKAVGKKALPKDKRPGWMTDKDAAPPLSRSKREELKKWLEENPGAPGWDEINEQLGIDR